jgi:hypothetical protein
MEQKMSVSQNFPNIKPSLLLDFVNSESIDPRITFSRASKARAYDGRSVAKAEENLLIRSQDYSATWVATNLTPVTGKTAPDATATATEFTASAGNATLTQSFTAVAGDYTFSVFLRRVTGTGDVDISAHSGGTWVTQTLTSTWTRFTVTQTLTAGARTPGIRVVTSGDAIEVWGAQIEFRASATAHTPTTTQPITNYIPVLLEYENNTARRDHNPVTGESLGLLVEEQRTNLLTYSEAFDDAGWLKTRSSITANTIVAPDGTLTGDKLVEDTTASSTHFVQRNTSLGGSVDSSAYTISVYAKAGERSRFRFRDLFQVAGGLTIFDLTIGTVVSGTGTITSVGNGWYRCSIFPLKNTNTTSALDISLVDSGTNASYTGDGFSGIYIWGAQLEAGGAFSAAFPTSYIKTEASQVTRSADAALMVGSNFSNWYRQDEGSFYLETATFGNLNTGNNYWSLEISNNTTQNYIAFLRGGSVSQRNQMAVAANNVSQASIADSSAFVSKSFNKQVGAYKVNDFAATANGNSVGVDSDGVLPVVDRMKIGFSSFAGVFALNGTIKKIAFWPKRLTNTELAALTS